MFWDIRDISDSKQLDIFESPDGGETIYKRKSGDYLIFATRHMFKREKYDLALTCVKLGNYKR